MQDNKINDNSPITIVKQWLTYAFWIWSAISIMIFSVMIFIHNIVGQDVSEGLPYSVAAICVLIPISILVDYIYRKKEPQIKTGISSVIMIIHAVIFALICVASLVVIVLNFVNILIDDGDVSYIKVSLFTALIMLVVCGILFYRVVVPAKLFKTRKFVSLFFIISMVVLVIFAAVGPIKTSIETKNDRLIENNIGYLVNHISEYARENEKLPSSLNDLIINSNRYDSSRRLIDDKLVEYRIISEGEVGTIDNTDDNVSYLIHKYELCVDYIKSKNDGAFVDSYVYPAYIDETDGYVEYISTYNHPAGRHCYKLKTTDYEKYY